MNTVAMHANPQPKEFVPFEDPEFEDALATSRRGMRQHVDEIDTALLVLGRTLDAALALTQKDEKQPGS